MTINRRMPKDHEFELVVIGGGLAGLCAALAAARCGVDTAIIQDRPVFGGNSSSEIRVVPYGCSHNNAWTNETGIPHELILKDRVTNHVPFFDHGLVNTHYDMVLLQAVREEPRLSFFLNTSVRGVEAEPVGPASEEIKIQAVYGSQLGSEQEYRFRAKQFIDATGDATVGYLAGADHRYGCEAREEFGENLAPVAGADVSLGSTITFQAKDIGRPVPFEPPPGTAIYRSPDDFGPGRPFWHVNERSVYGGFWWIEINSPYHQVVDTPAMREELHRHALGVWNYIKNHSPYREQAATYALNWIGMLPGKRESRRLIGDVTLTEHDCHEDRRWPDGVAYAGWWIDLHMRGGILNGVDPGERENIDDNYKHWIRIAPFTIPLRAYYSRNVENLWMAGRILSVSHVALGPLRVQLSLGLAGQAVGTAAAYALHKGLTPREAAAPQGPHISQIRQRLLRDDVHIFGLHNADPADLALRGAAQASSEAPLDFGEPNLERWEPLDRSLAQVVPITHDRIEAVSLYLKNEREEPVEIAVEIQPLERIWERTTSDVVACSTLSLPARSEAWQEVHFGIDVESGRPHRVVLHKAEGVSWATGTEVPTGTVVQYLYICPGGPEKENRHLPSLQEQEVSIPPYEHWRQLRYISLATRVTPQPHPFGASNVNNGAAWPEELPNQWQSHPDQPLPQWVELSFPAPVTFDTVLVSFDTGLDRTTAEMGALWRAPESVRDWRLEVQKNGAWISVFEERDNYQRRRTAKFEPVTASNLRLVVERTNGAAEIVRVYEVRVYHEGREPKIFG